VSGSAVGGLSHPLGAGGQGLRELVLRVVRCNFPAALLNSQSLLGPDTKCEKLPPHGVPVCNVIHFV
jgi:hypothetical protein